MIYKILIKKSKTVDSYSFYTIQSGTETVEYETTHLEDLVATYKALLAIYTTEQLRLIHELEPEIVINVEEETSV